MRPILPIPEFLILKRSSTVEKCENILYDLLDDDNISVLDTFKIMKQLERDIVRWHRMKT